MGSESITREPSLPSQPVEVVCIASWNADLIASATRPPLRGETLQGHSFCVGPGGKGSNASIAAARQGARVAIVARTGQDDFGRMGLALWQSEQLDTHAVVQAPGEQSGVALILVYPDGDNSIVVSPGANNGLDPAQVRQAAAALATCKVVMSTFEVPLAATCEAFALGRSAGACTVLNPAPAHAMPPQLAGLVDLLTPNESELATLTGVPDDPTRAAQILLNQGVGAVLVTLGAQGVAIYREHQPMHQLPGHRVAVRDTIGAGDTFNGALAAALARGEPLEAAARWANAAAALSVQASGAIAGMPRHAQVALFLQTCQP